jgi:hypothetical protein
MRFAAVLAAFFLLVPARADAAPAKPNALDALVAKARATSGAPYEVHIVSKSRETIGGRTVEITTETQGLKYRARRCYKGICNGFYFDGERSYESNLNDTALPKSSAIDGFELTLRAIATYAFTAPDFRANGGVLTERDLVMRGGKEYRRVTVAPRFGAALDAVIDPQTGVVAGVLSDARKLAFEFRDQRTVGGKYLLPFVVALNGTILDKFDERSVDASPLGAPSGLSTTFSGDASVPMRKLERKSPQVVVDCTIGSETVPCLLDTGNSGMSMSLELSEKLNLEPQSGVFGVTGVGQYVTGLVKAPPLTVGPVTFGSARYVVLHDLHQIGCDLVLGADVFAKTKVTLDYGARTVTFAPSNGDAAEGDLSFENFVPVAPIKLGDFATHLAVDIGDESEINLSGDYYAEHPAIFKPTGTMPVSGVGGDSEEITGTLPEARLGDFTLVGLKIGATKGLVATSKGHIGGGVLQHFSVTLDYARSRMDLVPRPGDKTVHPT